MTTLNSSPRRFHLSPGSIAIMISIVGFLLNYFFNLLLSQNLDADVYGDFYIVLQVVIVGGILGTYGTTTSIVKFLPKYIETKSNAKVHGYILWNRAILIKTGIIISMIGGIVAAISLLLVKLGITRFDDLHPAIFSFWLIPLYTVSVVLSSALQGFKKVNLAMFLNQIGLVGVDIIILFLLISIFKKVSIYQVLFLLGLARTILIISQLIFLKRQASPHIKTPDIQYENRTWNQYSQAMLANNFVLFAGNAVVAIIFEIVGKVEAEVGVYAAISTISAIVYTLSGAINTLFSPQISAYEDDKKQLQILANKALLLRLAITIPISVLIIIFGSRILATFNPMFAAYTHDFNISMWCAVIGVQVSLAASLLMYTGSEKLELYSNIFYLAIATILSLTLITKFQLTGAIWADSLATIGAYVFDFFANKFTSPVKVLFFI
jgi:O-antigen/teichoic acid export membrane protein